MFILETLNFVVDILKVPSVLVGLIALIGLVAQKKSFSDVVKGTIKTILGFIVLGGGATVLVGSLNPLGGMFEHAFNIQGIIPNNEAIVSIALEKYGASTALIMAFGMVANIVVARFTRLKYIFLTGHHTFYMACMIGVILTVAGFEGVGLVFTGSLILGLVMAFFPALAQRYMKRITGTDDIAFGHFGTLGYVLSGWIGSVCGKGSRSTEEMNLPKNLSFLRDSSISISLTMMIIYLIMAVSAGRERRPELPGLRHHYGDYLRRRGVHHPARGTSDPRGNRAGLYRIFRKAGAQRPSGAGLPGRLPLRAQRGADWLPV